MHGLLNKKVAGCDFDIEYFEEQDFEVHGWGWKGVLSLKDRIVGLLKVKEN